MKNFLSSFYRDIFNSDPESLEHRLVFETGGGAEAAGEAGGDTLDLGGGETLSADEIQKREDDAKAFLKAKAKLLFIPSALKIDANSVKYLADGTVESVDTHFKNIRATVEHDTPEDNINTFLGYVGKLNDSKFDAFVFRRPGSVADLKSMTVDLHIDMGSTLGGSVYPDALTISLKDEKITGYNLDMEPAVVEGSTFDTYLKETLINRKIDDIDIALVQEISEKADAYAIEPMGLADADEGDEPTEDAADSPDEDTDDTPPEEDEGPKLEGEKVSEERYDEMWVDYKRGDLKPKDFLGKTFIVKLGKAETEYALTLTKEGDTETLELRTIIGSEEIAFSIDDKGGFEMKMGDDVNLKVSFNDEKGEMTLSGAAAGSDFSQTIPIGDSKTVEINGVEIETNKFQILRDEVAGLFDKDTAEEEGGLTGQLGEFVDEAGGMFKEIMGTIQEILAVIMELLGTMGIELNSEDDPDRAASLLVANNKLGLSNIGKIKETDMGEFMDLLEPGNKPKTIANLEEEGFDVTHGAGYALYTFMMQIRKNLDEDNDKIDELQAEKEDDEDVFVPYPLEEEMEGTVNYVLIEDWEMFNFEGRPSNKWKKRWKAKPKPAATPAATPAGTETVDTTTDSTTPQLDIYKTRVSSLTEVDTDRVDAMAEDIISKGSIVIGNVDGTDINIPFQTDDTDSLKTLFGYKLSDIEGKSIEDLTSTLGIIDIGQANRFEKFLDTLHSPDTGNHDGNYELAKQYGISTPERTVGELIAAIFPGSLPEVETAEPAAEPAAEVVAEVEPAATVDAAAAVEPTAATRSTARTVADAGSGDTPADEVVIESSAPTPPDGFTTSPDEKLYVSNSFDFRTDSLPSGARYKHNTGSGSYEVALPSFDYKWANPGSAQDSGDFAVVAKAAA
ncbi:hypothetical protein HOG48_00700 [Candidatus Peregrinibacteria bacterium]|jgi:hypothetical protein|nr:hypothetical protein [Candidatus Peregrinibacteria bacterium]